MQDSRSAAVLVDYFETFLKTQDIDLFLKSIAARYTEGTLCRLAGSSDPQARRAAVMALGHIGSFDCNAQVARALSDSDPLVRELASHALWAIWFRADSPENNLAVGEVRRLNGQRQYHQAIRLADELIRKSPGFAEAHNQRAIACFFLERYEEGAANCRDVLKLNPYHFGALSGLGQCYLMMNRPKEALEVFRRASRLQPFDQDLRNQVERLQEEE